MAICASCGQENRDGDWTCRFCGAPLGQATCMSATAAAYDEPVHDKAYYDAPTTYGTAAPTIRPLESKSAWDRRSKLMALVVGLLVVAAVLGAVWFFVLRPAPGDEFVGSWKGALPLADSQRSGTVAITRDGNDFHLAFVGVKGGKLGPFDATLDDGKLQSALRYQGSDPRQQLAARVVLAYVAGMVDDFRLIFYFRGRTLYVEGAGKARPGVNAGLNQPVALVKAK